ncbi:hypothetical protein [Nocardia sp. NPDC050710]|uniref:hypothetical protein n=1 Tax=Nocardia sp. NPDC050710 TaxID=3157220 RepID=UPI0033DE9B19
MSRWPEANFALDRTLVTEAYRRVRDTLAGSPLLVTDAAEVGFSFDDLDRRMANAPDSLDGESLWAWLDGPDQYRWAALSVLVDAYEPMSTEALQLAGRVVVPASGAPVIAGDVHIDGDLILEDQAMVFVLGRLTVTGSLVAEGADYSMIGARDIACRDGVTPGEVLAVEAIRCPGTFLFWNNDYSSRAQTYSGGVLVDFERHNMFGRVDVQRRLTDWDFAAAARVLGLAEDDDITTAYAAKLLHTDAQGDA